MSAHNLYVAAEPVITSRMYYAANRNGGWWLGDMETVYTVEQADDIIGLLIEIRQNLQNS